MNFKNKALWELVHLLLTGSPFGSFNDMTLGDYFGILMEDRVTSFPFNVNENPMYNGTVMIFLGTAMW